MYDSERYRDGFKGIGLLLAGLFLSLFFGWRRGWDMAKSIFLEPQAADVAMAKADAILAATEDLEQREPEAHVSIARRFIAGDMDADVSLLGRSATVRLIAMRAERVDVSEWSDKRLSGEIFGSNPTWNPPRTVRKAAEEAYDYTHDEGLVLAV